MKPSDEQMKQINTMNKFKTQVHSVAHMIHTSLVINATLTAHRPPRIQDPGASPPAPPTDAMEKMAV